LSATRAACESRAIGFPFEIPLDLSSAYDADHSAVRDEPDMKNKARIRLVW
jgi:hypothetical protein